MIAIPLLNFETEPRTTFCATFELICAENLHIRAFELSYILEGAWEIIVPTPHSYLIIFNFVITYVLFMLICAEKLDICPFKVFEIQHFF